MKKVLLLLANGFEGYEAKNIITSTSPAAAINVAFTLLELITDKENCDKVRKFMGF